MTPPEYPTEEDLARIKSWDAISEPISLARFVMGLWRYPDYCRLGVHPHGFIKDRRVIRLELSTGGWSGNEEIMETLLATDFGAFFLSDWRRGGHYTFEMALEYNAETRALAKGKSKT